MGIFHRHDWSDWSITERGRVLDDFMSDDVMVGSYIVQDRFCRACGKHQIEQQRVGSVRSHVRLMPDGKASARQPQRDLA